MAKKRKPIEDKTVVLDSDLVDIMHQSMMQYSEHVILDRALPRVEDGLKPVQRRILYSMNELGTTPDKPHKKSARIVGECLGKYHPHGDSSVYDAMVRLAQPFNTRMMLVDGHGNFGSVDGDGAAAMRYTEARLAPIAMEMLRDLDKETVSFSLNFDDSLEEPDVLPCRFPNLLVNGTTGIAVGLATNIPPHNLGEVINGIVAYIDNSRITLDEMMKYIPAPDFPTGGIIIDNDGIREAYATGKGKITMRANAFIEKDGDRDLIVITEFPYQINKALLLSKINELREERKDRFGFIQEINDESDRNGMRAVIRLRKDTNAEKALAMFRNTLRMLSEPGFLPPKTYVPGRGHSITMMLINVANIARKASLDPIFEERIDQSIDELAKYFMHPEFKSILESVGPEGEFIDTCVGRTINPGHCIETGWFILDVARSRNWDKKLVEMGCVSKKLLAKMDIDAPVYYAELDWTALAKLVKGKEVLYTEISKYPTVSRDLALLIDSNIEFAAIEAVCRQTEKKLLKSVELFDVYEGNNLPAGKKSYAINLRLQDETKTLADKQIDAIMAKIITNLKNKLGAELR